MVSSEMTQAKQNRHPQLGNFHRAGNAVSQSKLRRAGTAPVTQQRTPTLCPRSCLPSCPPPAREVGSWSLLALFSTGKTKGAGRS